MPPRRRVDSEPKHPRGYRVGSGRYSQSVPAADSKQVFGSPASGAYAHYCLICSVRSKTACLASVRPLATGYAAQAFKSLWELINSSIPGLPTLTLKFAALVGYKPATDAMAAHCSAFDAEILYDDYDGTINVDKSFTTHSCSRFMRAYSRYTLVFPSTSCTEWWFSPRP
ncbi:hypothetical protein DFH08DRAFT_458171 [Mycena albidolilacea]|uniref:Uncharacterized protein n=1 Tax=Mycena albidolilacea TaxID=1033008 RepID=A0AAD7EBK7_9AGAR|nr:hypothetical protein DFH08DRAFT_458171 [Mycena albidolilacea]